MCSALKCGDREVRMSRPRVAGALPLALCRRMLILQNGRIVESETGLSTRCRQMGALVCISWIAGVPLSKSGVRYAHFSVPRFADWATRRPPMRCVRPPRKSSVVRAVSPER